MFSYKRILYRTGRFFLTLTLAAAAALMPIASVSAQENETIQSAAHSRNALSVDEQEQTVTISNGIVTATVNKGSAQLTSLSYKGGPNLLANGGSGYYILNYSKNGKALKFAPSRELKYTLTAWDSQHVDISLSVKDPAVIPFEYDMHFVLVKNDPGLYTYEILRYPEEVEGGASIGQGRYAIRVDPNIFKYYAVDDQRKGALPRPEDLKNGEEVMDATVKLPNGEVYTKYNHMVYVGDFDVTGLYGDQIGISQIRPSNEFAGGGPMQQRNTLHQTETTPILLWHDYESHMGRDALTPTKGWEKIYGPTFFYIHEGDGLDALWNDAKRKADSEQKKWPYRWLNDPLYASDSRGSVSGQLKVSDGTSAKDAWVILGEQDEDFQNQNLDYLYYARADEKGRFEIPNVRPGRYTLFAVVKGEFGQFRQDGVEVKEHGRTRLPTYVWTPERYGTTLWQIGIPDRTAGEYRHGDDYHQWGNWLDYPLDFPHGVDFYIGRSNERTDWNYAHPVNATPGEPSQVKVPYDKSLTPWRIRFDLDKPLTGKATLTIGLASSRNGSLQVALNGQSIANLTALPGPKSDSAMPRSAIHGFYREIRIRFDASLLKSGSNVIELKHAQNIFDEQGNRIRDLYTSIEYDAIRLEVDSQTAP
ncbi:polysaccharide lyase family protein [Paenibacillus sp. 32352]|uniref:polysaccharide lyase family protein n=1 Tax=Paenibacillus sp. 32352 TaxID=1969111 RepID=UPI0009ABB26A|nr:polysaccharide lyase family protein [Paenibacillus sp. 32352]